jgi:hypothetical protein
MWQVLMNHNTTFSDKRLSYAYSILNKFHFSMQTRGQILVHMLLAMASTIFFKSMKKCTLLFTIGIKTW